MFSLDIGFKIYTRTVVRHNLGSLPLSIFYHCGWIFLLNFIFALLLSLYFWSSPFIFNPDGFTSASLCLDLFWPLFREIHIFFMLLFQHLSVFESNSWLSFPRSERNITKRAFTGDGWWRMIIYGMDWVLVREREAGRTAIITVWIYAL